MASNHLIISFLLPFFLTGQYRCIFVASLSSLLSLFRFLFPSVIFFLYCGLCYCFSLFSYFGFYFSSQILLGEVLKKSASSYSGGYSSFKIIWKSVFYNLYNLEFIVIIPEVHGWNLIILLWIMYFISWNLETVHRECTT